MSAPWRQFFTWNKYTQIASGALRTALNETERVAAEKRATVGVKFQVWKDGESSESQYVIPPKEEKPSTPPV